MRLALHHLPNSIHDAPSFGVATIFQRSDEQFARALPEFQESLGHGY